jgi:hypothetical protein
MGTCNACGGSGRETVYVNGTVQDWKICSWCNGTGKVPGTGSSRGVSYRSKKSGKSKSSKLDRIIWFILVIILISWFLSNNDANAVIDDKYSSAISQEQHYIILKLPESNRTLFDHLD